MPLTVIGDIPNTPGPNVWGVELVNDEDPLIIPPVAVSNAAGPDEQTVADDGVTVTAPGVLKEFIVVVITLVHTPFE
jgi:hypothetical protein